MNSPERREFPGGCAGTRRPVLGDPRPCKLRPWTVWFIAHIKRQVPQRVLRLPVLFVSQREIEMSVSQRRQNFHRAYQVRDRFRRSPQLFEHAAQIKLRERIRRVIGRRNRKMFARFFHSSQLVHGRSQIDTCFHPLGRGFHRLAVGLRSLLQ